MKKIVLISICLLLLSCEKDNTTVPTQTNNTTNNNTTAQVSGIRPVKFYTELYPYFNIGSGIKIYINDTLSGSITSANYNTSCADNFGLKINLRIGSYRLTAKVTDAYPSTMNYIKDTTFIVDSSNCIMVNCKK